MTTECSYVFRLRDSASGPTIRGAGCFQEQSGWNGTFETDGLLLPGCKRKYRSTGYFCTLGLLSGCRTYRVRGVRCSQYFSESVVFAQAIQFVLVFFVIVEYRSSAQWAQTYEFIGIERIDGLILHYDRTVEEIQIIIGLGIRIVLYFVVILGRRWTMSVPVFRADGIECHVDAEAFVFNISAVDGI